MKYTVNVADIECALVDLGGEAKTKNIQDKVLERFCAGDVPENYQHEKSFRQTIQRAIENYCEQAEDFDPTKRSAKFIRTRRGQYKLKYNDSRALEEIESAEGLVEGAKKKVFVNAYERNEDARKKCLSYYGYSCRCCGFSFEDKYGELGKEFSHVHHIKPLSEIKESYVVDPIKDLIPLCANCHAIIHRSTPALPIDDLRSRIKRKC